MDYLLAPQAEIAHTRLVMMPSAYLIYYNFCKETQFVPKLLESV